MSNGNDDYPGYVDISARLLPDPSPEVERLMRKREAELEAKRRARALWRAEMVELAWTAVLWVSINAAIYMGTGAAYFHTEATGLPKGAALFWRPMWFIFQVVVNLIIIATMRLTK